ncbi:hypothetical protein LCGC14_1907300, partial [marine sediment metagenome]
MKGQVVGSRTPIPGATSQCSTVELPPYEKSRNQYTREQRREEDESERPLKASPVA